MPVIKSLTLVLFSLFSPLLSCWNRFINLWGNSHWTLMGGQSRILPITISLRAHLNLTILYVSSTLMTVSENIYMCVRILIMSLQDRMGYKMHQNKITIAKRRKQLIISITSSISSFSALSQCPPNESVNHSTMFCPGCQLSFTLHCQNMKYLPAMLHI